LHPKSIYGLIYKDFEREERREERREVVTVAV